jgi:Baseplate J-like protein
MALAAPKLDDRTWEDLVSEAKRRIAAKCPQWTDFNASDPGMMLVELMAWMTETVLYRLNRVPELNYVKFLELIGVRLQPAKPAKAWISFGVPSGIGEENLKSLPAGTLVSTLPQRDKDPVTFTTIEELVLTTCKIIKTGSRYGMEPSKEREEIVQNLTGENPWETDIFPRPDSDLARGRAVPHHLYLGDPALVGDPALGEFGTENIALRLSVEIENPTKGQLFLDWQAWDGDAWQTILLQEDTTDGLRKSGTVYFETLPPMKQCTFAQLKQVPVVVGFEEKDKVAAAFWLRARLIGLTTEEGQEQERVVLPKILKLERRTDLNECIIRPLKVIVEAPPPQKVSPKLPDPSSIPDQLRELLISSQSQNMPYPPSIMIPVPIETGKDFYPLGTKAEIGSAFYLGSDLFQKEGATIAIQFDLKEVLRPKRIAIHWEYFSRDRNWTLLGVSTQSAVESSRYKLRDGTVAFTRSGTSKVEFKCPQDIEKRELGGESGLFIRARVEDAEFESDKDAKVVAKSLSLGFGNEVRPWPFRLSENYSEGKSHLSGDPFSPFWLEESRDPAFYLCFDNRPSSARGPYHLFLDVVPQKVRPEKTGISWEYEAPKVWEQSSTIEGWGWRPSEPAIKPRAAMITWEYSTPIDPGERWKRLHVHDDGTEGFVHEGILKFHSPEDWEEIKEFEQSGFWLRVRWEIAEFLNRPRLRRVQLNVTEAEQAIKKGPEKWSSNGLANQSFSLYTSILEKPEIRVRESDADQEVPQVEQKPKLDVVKEADGYWVKWEEVRNFSLSQPNDRHFTVHLGDGTFEFGDGMRGAIPPKGDGNIRAYYRVTQGSAGNVGANTVTVLEASSEQVQRVTNVHPAEGGYDRESIEKAKERAPWEIKHRDRAVTAEDFIALAKKASPLVGRADCYGENGVIYLIIVPNDDREKPHPSQRLIEDVLSYLDPKRLINTRIKVRGPAYEAIDVKIEVVLDTRFLGRFEEIKRYIEESLRIFLHPLKGMDDGSGWPIGRTLHLSELYYRLEELTHKGVDHVERLKICKSGTKAWVDSIKIGRHSFPYFSSMTIEQSFG